jgi:hypothetical protein
MEKQFLKPFADAFTQSRLFSHDMEHRRAPTEKGIKMLCVSLRHRLCLHVHARQMTKTHRDNDMHETKKSTVTCVHANFPLCIAFRPRHCLHVHARQRTKTHTDIGIHETKKSTVTCVAGCSFGGCLCLLFAYDSCDMAALTATASISNHLPCGERRTGRGVGGAGTTDDMRAFCSKGLERRKAHSQGMGYRIRISAKGDFVRPFYAHPRACHVQAYLLCSRLRDTQNQNMQVCFRRPPRWWVTTQTSPYPSGKARSSGGVHPTLSLVMRRLLYAVLEFICMKDDVPRICLNTVVFILSVSPAKLNVIAHWPPNSSDV